MANILLTPQNLPVALGLLNTFMDKFRSEEKIIMELTMKELRYYGECVNGKKDAERRLQFKDRRDSVMQL
jgi:hypothetical protein